MDSAQQLADQIGAALASMEAKRRQFHEAETRQYEERKLRIAKLCAAFDRLRPMVESRLDVMIKAFGDKVEATPKMTQSTREILLEFHSEVARIKLRFQCTTDHDVRKLILNYDLDVIPILIKFDSHAALEMPLDAIDCDAAARWVDERILSFVQTYVAIHENQYYLHDQMVTDPVTGTTFPKLAAGATLQRAGRTHYFVSEATRREFETTTAAAQ